MRLDKKEIEELDATLKGLAIDRAAVASAVRTMEIQINVAVEAANFWIHKYNLSRRKARAFVQAIASGLRDEFDEKSDKWKESDAGQQAEAFTTDWEEANFDDLEHIKVLMPDLPKLDEPLNLPTESE